MFKLIGSFFWSDNTTNLTTLNEAYNVLNEADDSELAIKTTEDDGSMENQNYNSFHKTGIITSSKNDQFVIDSVYSFKSDSKNLDVGVQVNYTSYLNNGRLIVSNVSVADDWNLKVNVKCSWCTRKLVCQVEKRINRQLIMEPGNLEIDLDSVSSEFVPMIGDWVEIEAKVEIDENISDLFGTVLEIEKLRPLRPRMLHGTIKRWCKTTKTGIIDGTIFFNSSALLGGYCPAVGDKVVTESIESSQKNCIYRSLKVVPENCFKQNPSNEKNVYLHIEDDDGDSDGRICVTKNISIHVKSLGTKEFFTIELFNPSKEQSILLVSVTLPSNNSQCSIIKPKILTDISIKPQKTLTLEGVCYIKYIGTTKESIAFTFENFKIVRCVKINCNFNTNFESAKNANKGSFMLPGVKFKSNRNDMVKGQKLYSTPRFISGGLPAYQVPRNLYLLVSENAGKKDEDELIKKLTTLRGSLSLPLSYHIYEDRFHTLIHLEEIDHLLTMQKYSQERICFIKNGEYLMLEIENLSERRPSLLIGDQIIAKYVENSNDTEFEGVIHKIVSKHVYLKFAYSFHESYNFEEMSIMAVTSRASFRRKHQGIGLAFRNLGNLFLFPSKVVPKDDQVKFSGCDRFTASSAASTSNRNEKIKQSLQNLIAKQNNKSQLENSDNIENKTSTLLNHISDKDKSIKWFNKNLNCYQKEAVFNILLGKARPLPYIIFGPPGTGKTMTLVEVALQLLHLIPHSRLLIATPSNSAANLLALRLIDSGVIKPGDLIRLVAQHIIQEDSLPLQLIPYCATADLALRDTHSHHFKVAENGLMLGCNSAVVGRHRITIGTCSTLGVLFNMEFSKGHFTHILVDEAGQLTEPEIMIPFSFLDVYSGQVVLAGDPLQLGPVILSKTALRFGLDETYMERMINRFPYTKDYEGFPNTHGYDPRLVTQLVYNYRSLPGILSIFNTMFYDDKLIATLSSTSSCEASLLQGLREILPKNKNGSFSSVVFHGVRGQNFQSADCPSWFNPDEASQVFFYINELYRLGVKSSDIGVIAPYIKQVRHIRTLLNEAEFEVPKVGTIEEFQGHEFNITIISTVRSVENLVESDLECNLGFISIPRRINVAISRAKALLIIIGNPRLLYQDVCWRRIINFCVENESYCGCEFK